MCVGGRGGGGSEGKGTVRDREKVTRNDRYEMLMERERGKDREREKDRDREKYREG